MATATRVDPYSSFMFLVELDGITQAHFRECSGLASQLEVIENAEGGRPQVSKLPGRVKYPNIVLRWGFTGSSELYDWHMAALQGNVQRKDGSILQLDAAGNEKARWTFHEGWPTRWEGPTFSATASDVSVETLEIAYEWLERA